MSTLISLTHEISAQVSQGHPFVPAAGGGGILDWATSKNTQTQALFRAISITVAIIFVIWQAVASRLAMARIIISIVTAGILIWGVFNVTDIQDRVNNEVNSAPALGQGSHQPSRLALTPAA